MRPGEMDKMSICESFETNARHWLAFLETSEAKRLGVSRDAARPHLARRLREAPGTLENLDRGRLKGLRAALVEKLRLEFIRSLEREIGKLENELANARAGCGDLDAVEAREVATHLAALRAIVARRKGVLNEND